MDSEQRNPNNENNPAQNELDFGANERVTPKRVIQPEPSALDKLRGLFAKKENKESLENKFSERKEPVFASSQTQENPTLENSTLTQSAVENTEIFTSTEPEKLDTNETTNSQEPAVEPVVEKAETSQPATKSGLKNPENWAILGILPQKHRRLFIALLVLVLLLIFFFIMKPSSDTVQSFEQQNNNEVPIQFQSLDQSQPVENTPLDTMNAQTPPAAEPATTATENTNNAAATTAPVEQPNVAPNTTQQVEQAKAAETAKTVEQQPIARPTQNVADHAQKQAEEQARQERLAQEKAKAAERAKAQEKARAEEKARVEKAKADAQAKAERAKAERAAQMMKNNGVAPIIEAKPNTAKASAPATSGGSAKTLTVPQGVSLMQVFRDNNLNIADVNAMTKANGAGNALSSLKANEKVQVSVNAQGRVNELRLPNGARFIRQADGTYQFRK